MRSTAYDVFSLGQIHMEKAFEQKSIADLEGSAESFAKAIECFTEVIEKFNDNDMRFHSHHNIGTIYASSLENADAALTHYMEALKIPVSIELRAKTYFCVGKLLMSQEGMEETATHSFQFVLTNSTDKRLQEESAGFILKLNPELIN